MNSTKNRQSLIEEFAANGHLQKLKAVLNDDYTQKEIDIALENAIAYSNIEVADYLLTLGADISHFFYQGVYYAVHNNELRGLKFAIQNGVDVNINNGTLINTAIITAYNTKDLSILKWLIRTGADTSLISKDILSSFSSSQIRETLAKDQK